MDLAFLLGKPLSKSRPQALIFLTIEHEKIGLNTKADTIGSCWPMELP
ncbi:MAG: hypothetical protein JWQ21_2888 [Herminiimonas sp.]|nr:hypothetical protein [Herminiimonas sp.]